RNRLRDDAVAIRQRRAGGVGALRVTDGLSVDLGVVLEYLERALVKHGLDAYVDQQRHEVLAALGSVVEAVDQRYERALGVAGPRGCELVRRHRSGTREQVERGTPLVHGLADVVEDTHDRATGGLGSDTERS